MTSQAAAARRRDGRVRRTGPARAANKELGGGAVADRSKAALGRCGAAHPGPAAAPPPPPPPPPPEGDNNPTLQRLTREAKKETRSSARLRQIRVCCGPRRPPLGLAGILGTHALT